MRYLIIYIAIYLLVYSHARQACNDCYATSALKLIKHYKRRHNVTKLDLMRQSSQTCAGGVPDKILRMYFKEVIVTTGSVEKLHGILRRGPAIVGIGKHVFMAVAITDKGLVVDDPLLNNFVKLPRDHSRFEYICYINI